MAPPIGLGLGIPNNRVGRGAGGGGGGGGDLPTGGVFLDLDADVGVTLGPSSRTTEWLDNSPAANHLAEVDGAGFVLVPNSINGNSVLRADTTFKTLRRNLLTNGTISQPGTVYSVARWPTSGADGHMFSSTTNNSNRWIQGHIGNADHRPGMYAGTVVSSGTSVSGRVVVMRTYFDGASSESLVWAHGLSPFTFSGNVGAGTLSSVLIGGSQWSFLGDFARFFCLTRLTTAQEDVATMTIFANRYGVVTVSRLDMLRIKSCHTSGNDKREVNHKYVEPILSRELTLTTIPVFLNLPEVTEYPVSVMVSVEGTLDEGSPLPYVTPSDGAPLFDVEVRPGVGVCFPAPAGLLSIGLTCSNSTGVKFKVTVTK